MNRLIVTGILALATGLVGLQAQQPAAQPAAQPAPAAKQPRPKSQKEIPALQALFGAKDPDAVITAGKSLIQNFADTEFKDIALTMIADAYQRKGDRENAEVYADLTLKNNPKNYQALSMLAELISQRTREHDLDREEKLGKAEKYAKDAIAAIAAAPKPNPNATDEQWENSKKFATAQVHQTLGMIAMTRKKYDVAAAEMKQAVDLTGGGEPAFQVRLAQVYVLDSKNDEAIALCDKILAAPNLHPQIKAVTTQLKEGAVKQKASGLKPNAGAGPKQVEIKQ
jgi:tetratricopeptide (TPR) repeat protein